MPENLKACKTCLYHIRHEGNILIFNYCDNPDYLIEEKDYVEGVITFYRPKCYDLRSSKGKCGPEGEGWVENPTPEPEYFPSLWSALKHFIKTMFSL